MRKSLSWAKPMSLGVDIYQQLLGIAPAVPRPLTIYGLLGTAEFEANTTLLLNRIELQRKKLTRFTQPELQTAVARLSEMLGKAEQIVRSRTSKRVTMPNCAVHRARRMLPLGQQRRNLRKCRQYGFSDESSTTTNSSRCASCPALAPDSSKRQHDPANSSCSTRDWRKHGARPAEESLGGKSARVGAGGSWRCPARGHHCFALAEGARADRQG